MNLVKSAAKWGGLKKGGKVFIDLARHYKSKDEALLEINEAKLTSPIVLIDPTYAARNVTAAISDETFARFVHACKAFSAKPSIKFFEKKGVDARELEKTAARKKAQFSILKAESRKAKEDIAAAKLLKFSNFLVYFLEKNGFKILQKEIEFRKQQATIYLIYRKPSAEMIVSGPPVTIVGGVVNFKRKYKNAFVKNGMVYAKVKRKIRTIKDAISQIRKGDEIRDMGISKIEMLK
jgi:tRNA nucleotidyltransferase (CCA-adding enzyme)